MSLQSPRMTSTTVGVLEALASEPQTDRYGLELMALTGLPSGTVFPILARFEGLGWLESGWEDVDPKVIGRPARRYYHLTDGGLEATQAALARVELERSRRRSLLLRPATRPAAGLS